MTQSNICAFSLFFQKLKITKLSFPAIQTSIIQSLKFCYLQGFNGIFKYHIYKREDNL